MVFFLKPLGENRVRIEVEEYDINPSIQAYFTNTRLTTKHMEDENKLTVFNTLKNVGFHDNIHKKGLKSARMKDAMYKLPKAIANIRNPALPAIEIPGDYHDLQGEGLKFIKPSKLIDVYTRLEALLGLKLSGHTDTLTEASNLIDELYKKGDIQNQKQYRNALNKFNT